MRRRRRQKGRGFGVLGAIAGTAGLAALKKGLKRKRRQKGRGVLGVLGSAAKMGYKLGKDKRYKRMGFLGATGSYRRRPAPWEV